MDSTEDSNASEVVPEKSVDKSSEKSFKTNTTEKSKDSGICVEEPPLKKKKTKKGATSTAAAPITTEDSVVSMPSTSSTSKTKKVLPQSKCLFLD